MKPVQQTMGQDAGVTLGRCSQLAYKVLVSVQAIVLLMVTGLAASLLFKVASSAGATNEDWIVDPAMCSNCDSDCAHCNSTTCRRCDMDLTYSPLEEANGVHPGDMVVSRADSQGMSACQLHFNVNLNLGWSKRRHEVFQASVDSGVSARSQIARATINGNSARSVCPSAKDFDGDCSYLSAQQWDVKLEEGRFYSHTLFTTASLLMPFWFMMKMISLEPALVDFVWGKMTCGRMKTEGRSDKLLIDVAILGSSNFARVAAMAMKEFSKYFRFKIASNTLLWPITTLASVEKCPAHLFTELPGLYFYYFLSACAVSDLLYSLVFYICFAGADEVAAGRRRLLYTPMVCSTGAALVGFLVVLAKSSWSIIFGFNVSFGFKFDVSAELGTFFLFYLLLSLLELTNTMVNIARKVLKAEEVSDVAPSADQA